MSIQTSHHHPARPAHTRARAVGLVGLALALTGCGGGGEPTPESGQTTTAVALPSGNPTGPASTPASPSPTPTATVAAAELPSPDLERSAYDGEPRRLEEIFHLECLHVVDGEDVPETEDGERGAEEIMAWTVHSRDVLTDGWKTCPTQVFESIAIPTSFTVEAEGPRGTVERLRIYDASGELVGGFQDDVTARAPGDAELVQAFEITELPDSPSAQGEVRYLRTLLVTVEGEPQLLIDKVSAPAGTDPESLDVWDLAASPESRDLVYASIALGTVEQAAVAADSELAAVLRAMVDSFEPSVQ
jgi:hypothetical protein